MGQDGFLRLLYVIKYIQQGLYGGLLKANLVPILQCFVGTWNFLDSLG